MHTQNPVDIWQTVDGVSIAWQTLVGTLETTFPKASGNCFGMDTNLGQCYSVVNFYAENLEYLLQQHMITLPIKLLVCPGTDIAVVNDGRIPDNWYRNKFCEVCCPRELLPPTQRLKHLRDIDRGIREEHKGYTTFRVDTTQNKLKGTWTCETSIGESELNEDAVYELTNILIGEINKGT